ncbi:hypothetical protein ACHAWF_015720 [Thalassiosira exigua]
MSARKLPGLTAPSTAPPSSSCAPTSSSSSSSFSESNGRRMNCVSLVPITGNDDDGRVSSRFQERSLRQRNAAPTRQSSSAATCTGEEDESPPSSDDDSNTKGNPSPSILRSVLGKSPFLMGPHVFSTPDFRPPRSRSRKESSNNNDRLRNLNRGAPHSPLIGSPLAPTYGSSLSNTDLEHGEQNEPDVEFPPAPNSYHKNYAFVLRSRENIIIHFFMELKMFQTHLLFISFGIFWQLFHSTVTNLAYWQQAQLNAANRVSLRDVAFDLLPPLDGELWIVSEYICYSMLGIFVACTVSNLIVKWNAPHGRPIYSTQILRRILMTLVVCQTLRMISFLVTTLPGSSRQCRYTVPNGLTSSEMLEGVAPDEGNPEGWAPPTEINDIIFRVDASNGCGDLMFSSHTIFTMTFVCAVFKYFNFKLLKLVMALGQIAMVPFVLAARKHYSIDVFTALYVTPLVFEILWMRFPDRDTSADLAKYYEIRFYLAQEGGDFFSYAVSVWGREFCVDPDHLPVDIRLSQQHAKGPSIPWGTRSGETPKPAATIV